MTESSPIWRLASSPGDPAASLTLPHAPSSPGRRRPEGGRRPRRLAGRARVAGRAVRTSWTAAFGSRSYFGRNWDALIEVLAFSDPVDDRPVLLIWHDPATLEARAGSTFREVVQDAASKRHAAEIGPLLVVEVAGRGVDAVPPADPTDGQDPPRRAHRQLHRGRARAVARHARPGARDDHGHPAGPGPDRLPRGRGVQGRARRADRRHDRRRPLPRQQGRGLPPRLLRGRRPVRDPAPPRDRRARAHRQRPAPRRRGPGRVPASAVVPRRPGRADRGARRSVVGRARATRSAASSPAARTSGAVRPSASGGSATSSGVRSTRKSTLQSRNGCSTSASIRRPASMSAVTISPRPWSQPCSTTPSPTSAVGSAYEPVTANVERVRMLPVRVGAGAARRARRPRSRRPGRPGGSR